MFTTKIRHDDRSILDVDDSGTTSAAEWFVRNSDLETIRAELVPGTVQGQNSYTLVLFEPISEGVWSLFKSQNGTISECNIVFSSPTLVEPVPQEVLDFISWVGEEEAKKLTSLDGGAISYQVIETAIEQSAIEFDYLVANLSEEQKLVYTANRQHLIRVIARYRLDRICPREFVRKEYDSLIDNIRGISSVMSGGKELFAPVFMAQSCCPPRRCCPGSARMGF